MTQILYQGVVVGLTTGGDTASDCDYLDSGNGAGLQTALTAAASSGKDVWVRPGVIALASGPISVPSSVVVRFSGKTVVMPSSTDRRAFVCGALSTVVDLIVEVQAPSESATGAVLIEIGTFTVLERPSVNMSYTVNATNMGNESLRYVIKDVSGSIGCTIKDATLFMTTFEAVQITGASLTGISLTNAGDANAASPASAVLCPRSIRSDIPIDVAGNVIVTDFRISSAKRIGIRAQSASTGRGALKILGGVIKINPESEECIGIELATGAHEDGLFGAAVHNVGIFSESGDYVTSRGVLLSGSGVGAVVQGCTIDRFPVGIEGATTQTHANILGNTIRSATPAISVLGVSSNVSNNILISN